MAFVHNYYFVAPAHSIYKILGFNCLRRANGDDEYNLCGRCSHRPGLGGKAQYGAEWICLVKIQDVNSNVHIPRANMSIKPHALELPWTETRFYINRFLGE